MFLILKDSGLNQVGDSFFNSRSYSYLGSSANDGDPKATLSPWGLERPIMILGNGELQ